MDKNHGSNFFTIIAFIVIIVIIGYISYLLISSNNSLNNNNLKNNISKDNNLENINIQNNNYDQVSAKKEILYENVEIASFTSTLYDNEENRVYNITKACQILNNTKIDVGQEFSFNNTIGPMGIENGYLEATGFDSNGKLIKVSAGGMCQVSSTLYNVALLANLEITERHPHSRRVSYVPAGKDATVYYNTLDLKFINNTDAPILITAQNDKYNVTIKMYKIKQSN